MSFFFGLFIGITVGIGLIMGFVRSENYRSKRRSDLAATVSAFSKMTVEDSKKLLPLDFYPSWVVFSEKQKLTWLNLELTKIWPYVDQAASELIKTSVEPVLEQYRPVILSSLKFSKLTLGTVAPQFTGVSIIEDGEDGITMELEMQWDGNPSIVLDIKTKLGVSLPIQVKNIGFTGVFRLMFKPLVNEFPCFGAVCYSLRHKKKLDFTLKVVGGDVSSIPGISDAIESTIRDAIEDSITWPVRKIIPIIPGDYSDLELKPVGTLEVKLVQAKELTNKDIIGKSDPYAVVYIRPLADRMKKSKTINNQLNPIWNEHFEFIVEDASTQHLIVKIFDDEGVQASELIGCAQVLLKDLEPGKVKDVWLKLVKDLDLQRDTKNRGQVHLELLYIPFGMENSFTNPFAPKFSMTSLEKALKSGSDGTEAGDLEKAANQKKREVIVRGVLSVTVISAEEVPATDILGKADPYVILSLKKAGTKNKTRVVNDSLNPVWNQTFDFVVEDGLHDMLVLELYDHDTFGKDYIGRCIITLTRVILEGEYSDTVPLDGAKSGKLNLHLKWSAQPIYRDST
ncbi:synaptotagmin-5-like isoform X1 [Papaver somniferum]|uniref:synaptotagmin-5-like isoform X1 n=2 Tax=Papaver somniferum TaxID=3469 RepID=UPI000E6F85EF|nr:synaptotagmin-5-like isoform X1 [Papaver somniferum]